MKKRYRLTLPVIFLLLLLISACGSPSGPQVNITENEYTISSSTTTFSPGVSYHFTITNNGKVAHEFMILPKIQGSMSGMNMSDMDKMALAKAENIAPGQTATLDYTFSSSTSGTHPEFACYYPGHYESGMKEEVSIK